MEYIQKKYNELDAYIATLEAGTYNVEVDCTGVTADQLKGETNFPFGASPLGKKLQAAKEGAFFNLRPINMDSSVTDCSFMFKDCKKLKSIDTKAFTHVTNISNMFRGCKELTSIDTSGFTEVTNTWNLFNSCSKLTSVDTQCFTHVTDAKWMFYNCSALTSVDISVFTQATDVGNMFYGCTGLTSIVWGKIKPASNTDMFSGASAAKTITVDDYETKKWIDTNATYSGLTSYSLKANSNKIPESMLYEELDFYIPSYKPGTYSLTVDCTGVTADQFKGIESGEILISPFGSKLKTAGEEVFFNLKLHGFNSGITDISFMFTTCTALKSINTEVFTQVTNTASMFASCTGLTSVDISKFTQTTNTDNMFYNCTGLIAISWGNIKPTVNTCMFRGASAPKTITVDDYETKTWIDTNASSIQLTNYTLKANPDTIPESMPYEALDFYIPSYKVGTYNITVDCTDARGLISQIGSKLNGAPDGVLFNLKPTNVSSDTLSTSEFFRRCSKLKSIDVSAFSNSTNADNMFYGCSELLSVSNLKTFAKVTSASGMFKGCSKLTSINDEGGFSQIDTADSMFQDCTNLTSINTTSFTKVGEASQMFQGCSNLSSIDASVFGQVSNAYAMFRNCSQLSVINSPTFSNTTNANRMFTSCKCLETMDMSSFTNINSTASMFDGCSNLKSIRCGAIAPESFESMFINVPEGLTISASSYQAWDLLNTNKEVMNLVNPKFIELYEDLDVYIPTLPEGLTPVTVDCTSVSLDQYSAELMETSAFGKKFQLAGPTAKIKLDLVNVDSTLDNINNMFLNCDSLQEMDTKGLPFVAFADRTFMNCTSLTTVINTNVFNQCVTCESVFEGCKALVTVAP